MNEEHDGHTDRRSPTSHHDFAPELYPDVCIGIGEEIKGDGSA